MGGVKFVVNGCDWVLIKSKSIRYFVTVIFKAFINALCFSFSIFIFDESTSLDKLFSKLTFYVLLIHEIEESQKFYWNIKSVGLFGPFS